MKNNRRFNKRELGGLLTLTNQNAIGTETECRYYAHCPLKMTNGRMVSFFGFNERMTILLFHMFGIDSKQSEVLYT